MNFDLSEEQRMLADAVGKLFEAQAEDANVDSHKLWNGYLELGLLGLPFAEEQGGFGGGQEEIMLVMEAYGRTLGTAPYLQSVLMAGRLLALVDGGTASDALSGLLDGSQKYALCLFEPDTRYRWHEPGTKAERSDAGWTLSGEKRAVLNAETDTHLICPATTPEGFGLFLIPPGASGLSLRERPTPDGRIAADIVLDGVEIAEAAAIGDPANNGALVAKIVDGAILACCSEAIGAMEKLLALTVEYLGTRNQFGAPIGSFQVLQHRAADMLIALEQTRSMTIHAISMMDAPPTQRHVAVAAAKALTNRASRFVGSQAIQLHGGMGLASEYPAGRYFQRLTVLENMFGDSNHHLTEMEKGGGLAAAL
ncbi:acyl-CoA dehydrogenase [Parasphingopyxis marina]|uniref:Acyl-CoA dehydrogenase family protein n=1 Tax=Parasphingopyxis marina TaxID=2761622 RepID=A0A842I0Y3_9SPHN|nr:acyl-CoA dehydrogenase [Parasphingopyxis marina]MBC2778872.1 acyl-CoA dehydrogenase family protein [Parasphingopyxis marina]